MSRDVQEFEEMPRWDALSSFQRETLHPDIKMVVLTWLRSSQRQSSPEYFPAHIVLNKGPVLQLFVR
jgi:hypothetical protein